MSSRRSTNIMKRDRSRSPSSDRDSYERTSRNKNERSERPSRFSGGGGGGGGGGIGGRSSYKSRKVYVSNITFDATYVEVKEEFNTVGEVTFVQMLKDETNRFKGCAVITFKEPEMAKKALDTLNRREFKGRKLVVKEEDANPEFKGLVERKRPRDDFDNRPLSLAPPVMSTPINYNTYGLSMTFLESLKIDLPLVNIVFVANLDYTVDEAILREVFGLAGKVVECEIFKDKEGKSRGFGVVEYDHPVEAVQAISMLHNQTFRDRLLTVRMDRSDRKKDAKPRLPAGLKSVGMGLGIDGNPLKDVRTANPMATMTPINPMGQINAASLGTVNVPSLGSQMAPGVGLMDPMATRMGVNTGGLSGGLAAGPGVGLNIGRDYSQNSNYGGGGLGNIIQITNLPLDYTSENLRKLCWTYGDVRLAEMRSQGSGMVKFRTESDAQRAVEMLDSRPLEGRLLSARLL